MSECPEVGELEARDLTPAIRMHVQQCSACQLVIEMVETRNGAARDNCEPFENLLAVRADGKLEAGASRQLDDHLAACVYCRVIANGMMTLSDLRAIRATPTSVDLATLPEVDPDAYARGREVARGGMGRIVEARDLRIGRSVALKELLGSSATHAQRFEREARVTARLQHPGIVPIYEIGQWPDGAPFYSMRMVQGRTLRATIRESSTLGERLALLPSVIAAAEAVAYAHSNRIIHRDLTPANIMVGAFGETVVIDWGLAKDLSDEADVDVPDAGPYRNEPDLGELTVAGAVIGTAAYMPIEQASGDPVDERADVYALGAILYHLLAGFAPYKASTSAEILGHVKAGPPVAIDVAAPDAPRDLISIVAKAMSRAAADRYASARELAAELVRYRDGRIVEAHRYSRRELVRRWIRDHRALVVGSSAALVALVVVGSIAITGIVRERDRADSERVVAVEQRAAAEASHTKANETTRALLEEQGRQELLNGDSSRALAYLNEAFQQGLDTPAMRLMLASALRSIEGHKRTFDCAGNLAVPSMEWSVDTSPDNAHLVAACGVTHVWRLADGSTRFVLPTVGASTAIYSHDGRWIVTAGKSVQLWDATSGSQRHQLDGHGSIVPFVFFTNDDRHIVTLAYDGTAKVWETATGVAIRTLAVGSPPVDGVRGVVRGDVLALVSLHGKGELWNVVRGARLATFDHGARVANIDLAADGSIVSTCGEDRSAKLWSSSGRIIRSITAHERIVTVCTLAPNGHRVLVGSHDGNADLWDISSGRMVVQLPHNGQDVVKGVFDRRGARIATWSFGGEITLWDAETGALLQRFVVQAAWGDLRFGPDDVVLATESSRVVMWDASVGPRVSFLAPDGEHDWEASPDGSRLVTRDPNGTVTLWNTTTGQPVPHVPIGLRKQSDHGSGEVDSIDTVMSTDGTRLAAVSGRGVVVLDTATGSTVATIPLDRPNVDLRLDGTGRRLLVGSSSPQVWDVNKRTVIRSFDGKPGAMAMSDDGRRVLVKASESVVEVWNVDENRPLSTIKLAPGRMWTPGFNADATRVAIVEQLGKYGAGRIGLWNTDTGERLLAMTGTSVSFDPEKTLLTIFGSGRVDNFRMSDAARLSSAQIQRPHLDASMNQSPVSNTGGAFIVTNGDLGHAANVRDAKDGRVLVRLGRFHASTTLLTGGRIETMVSGSFWSPGAQTVVVVSRGVSIWDLPVERRSPTEIDQIVRRHVPWRVDSGRLVAAFGNLAGKVTRGGQPVANATVKAAFSSFRSPYETTTKSDGSYELPELPSGEYVVTATIATNQSQPVATRIGWRQRVALDLELK